MFFLSPLILSMTGVMLSGVAPGLFELAVIAAVTGIAALMAAAPALSASRRALADGLTIRI
jgi:putative ABC transport system permease protein